MVHIANARFVRCFERKRKAESRKIPPNFFFVFGALMRSFTPGVRVQKGGESPTSLISPPKYEEEAKQNFKIKTKTKIQNRARARERERQIPPLAMRDEPPARQNERRGRNYTILCLLGLLSFSLSLARLLSFAFNKLLMVEKEKGKTNDAPNKNN